MTCAALGWSRSFWSQSIIAEVYALNCLLLAGTLYCFVNWRITRRQAWFVAACAVYAFSFGNHLTTVTLLPAFVFGTFAGDRSVLKHPKLVLLVVSVILAALSLYAYPLWRSQAGSVYLEYHLNDLSDLIDYVTGERYRGKMLAFGSEEVLFQRLPRFIGQIVSELGLLGLLIPAGALACKDGWVRGVLGLGFLGELLWIACYDIPDIQVYIMPVALLGATFAGLALDAMVQQGRLRTALVGVVAALSVLILPYYNLAHMSNDKATGFSDDVTRQLDYLGERAVIVGRISYSLRMAYIYHLYAEGLSEKRELHLCDNTNPSTVAAYLRGEASLKDSYTKQRLPAGLRVYISDRAAKEGWTRQKDYRVGPRVERLRELSAHE